MHGFFLRETYFKCLKGDCCEEVDVNPHFPLSQREQDYCAYLVILRRQCMKQCHLQQHGWT